MKHELEVDGYLIKQRDSILGLPSSDNHFDKRIKQQLIIPLCQKHGVEIDRFMRWLGHQTIKYGRLIHKLDPWFKDPENA